MTQPYRFTPRIPRQRWPLALLALAILLAGMSHTGCGKRRTPTAFVPATVARSADYLLEKSAKGTIPQTLFCKIRLLSEFEGQNVAANASMYWVKDSLLWVSVKKFGLEALRIRITPDSTWIINRLDQEYQTKSTPVFAREYGLPEGFPLIQHFILARVWTSPNIPLQSGIRDSLYRLNGSGNGLALDYSIEEGRYLLRNATMLSSTTAQMIAMQFDKYDNLPGLGQFPYLRNIEAYSPESGVLNLSMELYDVELNANKAVSFDIPAHYARTQ